MRNLTTNEEKDGEPGVMIIDDGGHLMNMDVFKQGTMYRPWINRNSANYHQHAYTAIPRVTSVESRN